MVVSEGAEVVETVVVSEDVTVDERVVEETAASEAVVTVVVASAAVVVVVVVVDVAVVVMTGLLWTFTCMSALISGFSLLDTVMTHEPSDTP